MFRSFPRIDALMRSKFTVLRRAAVVLLFAAALVLTGARLMTVHAQSSSSNQSSSSSQTQKPQQQAPAEAGGPTGDTGAIAIPKKKPADDTPAPPPVRRPAEKQPEYTITTDVPLVQLDVLVTTKDGHFIPGLKRDHFRVTEDGVPQKISNFGQTEAPITAVMLVEFANKPWYATDFLYDTLRASYTFAQTLKKEDWVAVVAYDMKPEILVDFTQDKNAVYAGLNRLRIPGFSETNLFDALYDTIDRLQNLEGRKYIILISTGCDSFSKLTYDKILKKVKSTNNIVIYAVSSGQAIRTIMEGYNAVHILPCTNPMGQMEPGAGETDFLQADNQMKTFAQMTGGKAYFPRFEGQFPEVFGDIANTIRNEYLLAYHPTNPKLDGTYRHLKIELVDNEGKPLHMRDEKGKEIKYQVVAREGYTAKNVVD